MSSINSVSRSMNGIKTIETAEVVFTDDNSSLNTSAGIVQAQANSTTALNGKINSVDFNTSTGVLTLNKEDGGTITKDLDGRYFEGTSITASDIPDLNASKINAGIFDIARIPDLNASKINDGILDTARIPDLNASKINDGILDTARIPDLDTAKITTGIFDIGRIPDLNASKINAGIFDIARIPDLAGNYVETTGNETIAGVKTFSSPPECSTAPTTNNQLANKSYIDNNAVKNTGNETIAGVKTFSSPPECSTAPTTNNQLANKSYVDSQGGTPSNMVTTDTDQFISGGKIFDASNTTFKYSITQDGGSSFNYFLQSGANCFIEQTQSTNKIITQGKIGIGTQNPNYALEVIGEAYINDTDAGAIRIHSNQINFDGINDFHGSNDTAYIGRLNNDLYIVNGNNYDNDIRIYAASHPVTYSGGTDAGRVVTRHLHNQSDNRIKHNEEIITNALNDIRQLTPKKYWKLDDVLYDEDHNFNFDNSGNPIDDDGNRVSAYIEHGLIAQDVLKIDALKYFVGKPRPNEENSTYSLEYNNIFIHTISALKELDAIVSQQQTKIQALEKQVNDM